MDLRSIAAQIRSIRVIRRLTQEQLADLVGTSQGRVSVWENGEARPEIEYLAMLSVKLRTQFRLVLHGALIVVDFVDPEAPGPDGCPAPTHPVHTR